MARSFQHLVEEAAKASAGIPALSRGVEKLAGLEDDPDSGLFRVRKLFECVVHDIFQRRYQERPGSRPLENLIQRLFKDDHLPQRFSPAAGFIRELGNRAVHHQGDELTVSDVEAALAQLVPILVWYREQVADTLPKPPEGSCGDGDDEPSEDRAAVDRIARPPKGDIGEAIEVALREVDALVLKLGASLEDLGLMEIAAITSEAIHHGAGIYNAGSFLGCARIYHHAARRVIGSMSGPFSDAQRPPPMGERLAAEWLARIVQASPKVAEPDADDLAWELRFAFDSIQDIPLLDTIHESLAEARAVDGQPDAGAISGLVRRILILSQEMSEDSRRAYCFQHTARVLLWIADHPAASPSAREPGLLRDARRSLRPIVDAHPRITRSNARGLAYALGSAFTQAIEADHTGPEEGGKWYDPRNWFRHS